MHNGKRNLGFNLFKYHIIKLNIQTIFEIIYQVLREHLQLLSFIVKFRSIVIENNL